MSSNILKADNGVSSGTTGLVYTAGNDGTLQLATTTSGGSAVTALTIDNNQIATFANKLTAASMPTGSVVQVVQGTFTSVFSTTGTSFTSTGLTASITPQFSTSKILVLISTYGLALVANGQASYTIYRNSTNLASGSGVNQSFSELNANLSASQASLAISYLDSPSTTSSTTYTLYAAAVTSGDAVYINNSNGTAVIILMEIR